MGDRRGLFGQHDSGMDEHEGRPWKEWQQRWDATPEAQRYIIWHWATVSGSTDSKSILSVLASIHVGHYGFDHVLSETDRLLDIKFDSWYSEHETFTAQQPYDRAYWTKDKIKELWKKKGKLDNYDLMTLEDHAFVEATLGNDYIDKKEQGFLDAKGDRIEGWEENWTIDENTGIATEIEGATEGGEKTENKWQKEIRDIFEDAGFSIEDNQRLYDKLVDDYKKGLIDPYQAEQLMEADPDYVKQESEKLFNEFLPKIDEAEARELQNIAEFDTESATFVKEAFDRIAPELAQIARQMGGIAGRGDTFVTDTLAKERATMEGTRATLLAAMRLQAKTGQEDRKQLMETGQYEKLDALMADQAKIGLDSYQKLLESQVKTTERLQAMSLKKSEMLATRAADRYTKKVMQEMQKEQTRRDEATSRANKKARKLGAILHPTMGAVSGFLMGGGPVGAIVGAGIGYAQNQMYNQYGVQAPNLASAFTSYGNIGKKTDEGWDKFKAYWEG